MLFCVSVSLILLCFIFIQRFNINASNGWHACVTISPFAMFIVACTSPKGTNLSWKGYKAICPN